MGKKKRTIWRTGKRITVQADEGELLPSDKIGLWIINKSSGGGVNNERVVVLSKINMQ